MARLSVREIARRSGVSAATVSRVLNDRPGVSPELREKVLVAVREQGWPRSERAAGSSPLVGIIVPELENPSFPQLAFSIETRLAFHGITGLIGSSTLIGYAEDDYIETLLRHGVHGLVLVSGAHANAEGATPSFYRRLLPRGIATVFVHGYVEGVDVPSVGTDEAAGARIAMAHLYSLGHRRIGLAGGERFYRPSINRLEGYRQTLEAHPDLARDPELYAEAHYTIEGGRAAGLELIRNGATGIIAGSDMMAFGVIAAARDLGLSVPDDVSVIGYDDTILASLGHPPLTSVQQPMDRISTAIATLISHQLQGLRAPRLHHRFEPTLVARSSTGPAAVQTRSP